MSWCRPPADELWRAVAIYLATAYPNGGPPPVVQARIELAKSAPTEDELYQSKSFERDASVPPKRYSIRLGNASYPHMKLVIEPAPGGTGHLFRADTHDAHCLPPPTSKEFAMVSALIESNGRVAAAIESAWRDASLPTFRGFLKDDLARRAAAAAARASGGDGARP